MNALQDSFCGETHDDLLLNAVITSIIIIQHSSAKSNSFVFSYVCLLLAAAEEFFLITSDFQQKDLQACFTNLTFASSGASSDIVTPVR